MTQEIPDWITGTLLEIINFKLTPENNFIEPWETITDKDEHLGEMSYYQKVLHTLRERILYTINGYPNGEFHYAGLTAKQRHELRVFKDLLDDNLIQMYPDYDKQEETGSYPNYTITLVLCKGFIIAKRTRPYRYSSSEM